MGVMAQRFAVGRLRVVPGGILCQSRALIRRLARELAAGKQVIPQGQAKGHARPQRARLTQQPVGRIQASGLQGHPRLRNCPLRPGLGFPCLRQAKTGGQVGGVFLEDCAP